jgi:predicted DNA-binding transcriptional regulator AlpA
MLFTTRNGAGESEHKRMKGSEMAFHQAAAPAAEPEVLTKSGVASLLSVSTRQIENLIKAGRLPRPLYLAERSPRWLRADLLQWLRERAAAGQQQ